MPYKVVQTCENGELLLSYIPESWEIDGVLYWPPSLLQADKLRSKEDSRPGNNWLTMECEVKSRNLTHSEAKYAVQVMSDIPDTEEVNQIPSLKRRKIISQKTPSTPCNYNKLAEQCVVTLKRTPLNNKTTERATPKSTKPDIKTKTAQVPLLTEVQRNMQSPDFAAVYVEDDKQIENNSGSNYLILDQQNQANFTMTDKVDMLFSAIIVIQDNQKKIEENQHRILKMIANMDSKMDEFFKRSQKMDEFVKRSQDVRISGEVGFQPINNKNALIALEEELKNPAKALELKQKFLFVCGSGKGKGLNNCYSLVDVMFTRRFFTECSWAGGSRDENNKKISFKQYELTLNFFFSIIQESDSTFTILECNAFFKNILRNSNKRYAAKGLRMSCSRLRKKNVGKCKKTTISSKSSSRSTDEKARDPTSCADVNVECLP